MSLEDDLKAALRREDPSPGFAQRVVARAQSRPARKAAIPGMYWAAAMAATLVIGFGVTSELREKKAERAGHEAVLALQITAEKLNMARDKILKREN